MGVHVNNKNFFNFSSQHFWAFFFLCFISCTTLNYLKITVIRLCMYVSMCSLHCKLVVNAVKPDTHAIYFVSIKQNMNEARSHIPHAAYRR